MQYNLVDTVFDYILDKVRSNNILSHYLTIYSDRVKIKRTIIFYVSSSNEIKYLNLDGSDFEFSGDWITLNLSNPHLFKWIDDYVYQFSLQVDKIR